MLNYLQRPNLKPALHIVGINDAFKNSVISVLRRSFVVTEDRYGGTVGFDYLFCFGFNELVAIDNNFLLFNKKILFFPVEDFSYFNSEITFLNEFDLIFVRYSINKKFLELLGVTTSIEIFDYSKVCNSILNIK